MRARYSKMPPYALGHAPAMPPTCPPDMPWGIAPMSRNMRPGHAPTGLPEHASSTGPHTAPAVLVPYRILPRSSPPTSWPYGLPGPRCTAEERQKQQSIYLESVLGISRSLLDKPRPISPAYLAKDLGMRTAKRLKVSAENPMKVYRSEKNKWSREP